MATQMMQEQGGEALRVAQRQVRIEHLLLTIQKTESISVDSAEVDRAIAIEAESTGSPLPRVKARYNDPSTLARVEARVLREKTIATILGDENPYKPTAVEEEPTNEEANELVSAEAEESNNTSDATDAAESDSTTSEPAADAAKDESPEETT
jgi:FKBP-type peptidyl-prolyl cis-trans isomerase (trigger factor)